MPPVGTPLETLLLRFRLVSPDQVAQAMREEAETGKDVASLVVEHGWVSQADLDRVRGSVVAPAPTAPSLAVPDPVAAERPAVIPAAPAPAAPPTFFPAPAAAASEPPVTPSELQAGHFDPPVGANPRAEAAIRAQVFVRLSTGERIEAGTYDDHEAADKRAAELMAELADSGAWPLLGNRYVKPDAVVSIDLDLPEA